MSVHAVVLALVAGALVGAGLLHVVTGALRRWRLRRRFARSLRLEEDVVWGDTEALSSDERLLRVAYTASESLLPATGHVTKVIVNGESLDKDQAFVAARHAIETLTLTRELLPHASLQAGLRAELFPWLLGHASP